MVKTEFVALILLLDKSTDESFSVNSEAGPEGDLLKFIDDIGYTARQTTDGGYIIIGTTYSGILIGWRKQTIRHKNFVADGYQEGRFIQPTSDGGYILT